MVTVIAGLHHAETTPLLIFPTVPTSRLTPNAETVFDDPSDDNLEAYVKGVIGVLNS